MTWLKSFFYPLPDNLQFFFVLRKKTSQVTTLHVIHHGVMPMSGELLLLSPKTLDSNLTCFLVASLVRSEVHTRRSFYILRSVEYSRSHCDVYLLLVRRNGASISKILMVEKIPHGSSDGIWRFMEWNFDKTLIINLPHLILGSVRSHLRSRFPTSWTTRLRLPKSLRVVDRHARCYVLLFVQRILSPVLWWKEGKLLDLKTS